MTSPLFVRSKSGRLNRMHLAVRSLPQSVIIARMALGALMGGALVLMAPVSSASAVEPTPTATQGPTVANGPDLVVHIPLVQVSYTNSGVRLEASAIIENQGNVASGSFRVGFQVGGTAVEVHVGSLAPGQVDAVVKTIRASLAPGAHVLVVTADSADAVAESDETNNTGTKNFNITGPDLVIEGLTASAVPKGSGFTVQLEATVRNVGDGAAGRFGVDFIPSVGSVHGNAAVRELAAGAAATAAGSFAADAGTYGIHVVVDPSDRVLEYDESNNAADFVITVP